MSLARSGGSQHRAVYIGWGIYRLSWRYEVKYAGSRILHHRTVERDTDRKGAERFAKKWKIEIQGGPP